MRALRQLLRSTIAASASAPLTRTPSPLVVAGKCQLSSASRHPAGFTQGPPALWRAARRYALKPYTLHPGTGTLYPIFL